MSGYFEDITPYTGELNHGKGNVSCYGDEVEYREEEHFFPYFQGRLFIVGQKKATDILKHNTVKIVEIRFLCTPC